MDSYYYIKYKILLNIPLYKNLKLLNLTDLYNFKLAKFYYLLVHDELPSRIYENFTKIHDHNTMRSKEIAYYVPRFSKSLGQNHIPHRGTNCRSRQRCFWLLAFISRPQVRNIHLPGRMILPGSLIPSDKYF